MYPQVTPAIRTAIVTRYRLLPYFYTLLWQAHADDEPMLRPTFLDHEHDKKTFEESDDFLMGHDLLVASVVEEGQRERQVYLPDNGIGWCDFYTGEWFAAARQLLSTHRWIACRCWFAPAPHCRNPHVWPMLTAIKTWNASCMFIRRRVADLSGNAV